MTRMIDAATTLPVHDAPCEHRWHCPAFYGPVTTHPITGRLQLPFAILGPAHCTRCGISKFAAEFDWRVNVQQAIRYIRERHGKPTGWAAARAGSYQR